MGVDSTSLEEVIKKRIGEGWKLQGGVSCIFLPQKLVLLQAVIKKESWLSWIKRLIGDFKQ